MPTNNLSTQQLTAKLIERGISADGARQLIAGQSISELTDRSKIAQIIRLGSSQNEDI